MTKTIRQQQKAMSARVEKLARTVSTKTELEKELYIHDFICENIHYDKLKSPIRMKLLVHSVTAWVSARVLRSQSKFCAMP